MPKIITEVKATANRDLNLRRDGPCLVENMINVSPKDHLYWQYKNVLYGSTPTLILAVTY